MNIKIKEFESKKIIFIQKVIKKGSKSRVIYMVDNESQSIYKKLNIELMSRYISKLNSQINRPLRNIPHAYYPGRSAYSNAKKHQPFDFTISMDIKNHFNSITVEMAGDFLSNEESYLCFIDGFLPQGLSTSPVISNAVMIKVDWDILCLMKDLVTYGAMLEDSIFCHIKNFSYTRYSDDLTISFNVNSEYYHLHKKIYSYIDKSVQKIMSHHGFKLNNNKKLMQLESNGFRVVTGVSVSRDLIKPTRKTKRKLRAAMYNSNVNNSIGIYNWVKLVSRA